MIYTSKSSHNCNLSFGAEDFLEMKSGEHLLWKNLSHPDSLGNSVIEGSSELHTVCTHLKPLAGLFLSLPSSISSSSAGMSYHFSCLFNICFLLCPVVLIFYESWSFSHIQDSVDNPKDNSICLILQESEPSAHGTHLCIEKTTTNKTKNPPDRVQRGHCCLRRFGEFLHSEGMKRNKRTSRLEPFQKASAHS